MELNDEQRQQLEAMKAARAKLPRQCEHIKTNGEFCGSPALRGRNYCYFHLTLIGRRLRAERAHAAAVARAQAVANSAEAPAVALELPPLEDANSIQTALMQVIDAILHNRLDNKRAGLVLYALQTASSNLANGADFSQAGGATVAAGYDSFEQDYELGDDLPELKADERPDEVRAAELVQIEQRAAECARLDAEEAEENAHRIPTEHDADDPGPQSYPCGHLSQFFCSLDGPLARARRGEVVPAKRTQREAASQRVELGTRAA